MSGNLGRRGIAASFGLATFLLAGCPPASGTRTSGEATTVFVVRHAEKHGHDDAALLSPAGHARARALANMLGDVPLAAIYATRYRRTQQTVQPTADALGLTVRTPRHGPRQLIARILREHRGLSVLIAGHSNTVPEILVALGVTQRVELRSQDYGDLFVVTRGPAGTATIERRRFGD